MSGWTIFWIVATAYLVAVAAWCYLAYRFFPDEASHERAPGGRR